MSGKILENTRVSIYQ